MRVAVVSALVIAALMLLPGLLLRGPLLAWSVRQVSKRLCGEVAISGGRVDLLFVPRLLLHKPIRVQLRDVQVHSPTAEDVLRAQKLELRLSLLWWQKRLLVHSASLQSGHWLMAAPAPRQPIGFLRAFRFGAKDATACMVLAPKGQSTHVQATSTKPLWPIVVEDIRLRDFTPTFDFPMWGLTLQSGSAHGTFSMVDHHGRPRVFFDIRDFVANRGGTLRLGRAGKTLSVEAPFDHVVVSRVAVTKQAPYDVILELEAAETGPAKLSGTAVFIDALMPRPSASAGGIRVEGTWDQFGHVLPILLRSAELEADKVPNLEGSLRVSIKGPYRDLLGELRLEDPRIRAEVSLLPEHLMRAQLTFSEMPAEWLLPSSLESRAAGKLSGHLGLIARLQIAPTAQLTARISSAALDLKRPRKSPGPQRLQIRIGEPSEKGSKANGSAVLTMREARFDGGALEATDVGLRWPGLSLAHGEFSLRFRNHDGGRKLQQPVLRARLPKIRLSLDRLIPGALATGTVQMMLAAQGPLDAIALDVTFSDAEKFALKQQRFALPKTLALQIHDLNAVQIQRFQLRHLPEGVVEAWGRVKLAGPLDVHLVVSKYPLHQLAVMATPSITDWIKSDTLRALALDVGESVQGQVDASLRIAGHHSRPKVHGQVALSNVVVAGQPLGNGGLSVSHLGGGKHGLHVQGRLVTSLGVDAQLAFGTTNKLRIQLDPHRFPVGAFVSEPGAPFGDLMLSGTARLGFTPGDTVHTSGLVTLDGQAANLAVGFSTPTASPSLNVEGTISVAPLLAALPGKFTGQGLLGLNIVLERSPDTNLWRPRGRVLAAGPISLSPPQLPFAVTLDSGSTMAVQGHDLTLEDVVLRSEAGVVRVLGRVAGQWPFWQQSQLQLHVAGDVDPGAIAAWTPSITSASGTLALDLNVEGPVSEPTLQGQVMMTRFALSSPLFAAVQGVTLDGVVHARGTSFSTTDLKVKLGSKGQMLLGRQDAPAVIELEDLQLLQIGKVDVPLRGFNLHTARAFRGLSLRGVNLDLRLLGQPRSGFRLTGEVQVDRALLNPQPTQRRKLAPAAQAVNDAFTDLARELELDVLLQGKGKALGVAVPVLPDVDVTFRCHIKGRLNDPNAAGKLRGSGAYSRIAVWLYDLFAARAVSSCDVLPG